MTKVIKLENGITVICEERKGSGRVAMNITIGLGTLHEKPVVEDGLTGNIQRTSLLGTKTRSAEDIKKEQDKMGAVISSHLDDEKTSYSISTLARHAKGAFDLLSDVVLNPTLLPDNAAMLQKHEQILSRPARIVISFVGDIDAATAEQAARDYFSHLQKKPIPIGQKTTGFQPYDNRIKNSGPQTTIAMQFQAPAFGSDGEYAAHLLKAVLIDGFNSLLYQEIRDKRGLSYEIGLDYEGTGKTGVMSLHAKTDKGRADELTHAMIDVLGGIVQNGIDEKVLEQSLLRMMRSLEAIQESLEAGAAYNTTQFLKYGRLVTLEELRNHFAAVTSDDLRRLCLDMLKDGIYGFAASGPQDTVPAAEDIQAKMKAAAANISIPPAPAAEPAVIGPADEFNPAAGSAKTPVPKMTILPNGLKVVTVEQAGNLSCGIWVGSGADCETPATNGAAHMIEHMMFRGSSSYKPGEAAKIIETELGGDMNAMTLNDRTAYYLSNLLPEDADKAIDILGDMVFRAIFTKDELDGNAVKGRGEKNIVIEEITAFNKKIENRASTILTKIAYAGQPRSRPVGGTVESLRGLTVEDLTKFRDAYYVANNAVICAAGPVKHEDFVALINQKFGAMPREDHPPLPQNVYTGGMTTITEPFLRHCGLSFALPTVTIDHPDFYTYQILGMILNAPEKRKILGNAKTEIAYITAFSDRNTGYFTIDAKTESGLGKAMIEDLYKGLKNIAASITQEDLDNVRTALENGTLATLESNQSAVNYYATMALTHGKVPSVTESLADLEKVTLEDLKKALDRLVTSNPTAVFIVPKGPKPQNLPSYGDILVIRDAGKTLLDPPKPAAGSGL